MELIRPAVLAWAIAFRLMSPILVDENCPAGPGVLDMDSRFALQDTLHSVEKLNMLRLSRVTLSESGTIPQGLPAEGITTSGYGWRLSPVNESPEFHRGIDICNLIGTPITATAAGKVIFSGWQSGYGYLIILDHGNGVLSFYGHNSEIWAKVGREVKRGEILGFMGSTGMSTGSHVHYEVWADGRPVNPGQFLNEGPETDFAGGKLSFEAFSNG